MRKEGKVPELESEKVTELFFSCLYSEEELPEEGMPEGHVAVHGMMMNIGFHPERLKEAKPIVAKMIGELPSAFFRSNGSEDKAGGGWSFLNLCARDDGVQWTGSHEVMEQFLVMALGLGLAEFCLPRDMWSVLPGGVPYISFTKEG